MGGCEEHKELVQLVFSGDHLITEYPDLEGTHKDHRSATIPPCVIKDLENGNMRVRGTRMQIQQVSAADLNALNKRWNLHEDNEQEDGGKKKTSPCVQ